MEGTLEFPELTFDHSKLSKCITITIQVVPRQVNTTQFPLLALQPPMHSLSAIVHSRFLHSPSFSPLYRETLVHG